MVKAVSVPYLAKLTDTCTCNNTQVQKFLAVVSMSAVETYQSGVIMSFIEACKTAVFFIRDFPFDKYYCGLNETVRFDPKFNFKSSTLQ